MKKIAVLSLALALILTTCFSFSRAETADGAYTPDEFIFTGGTGRVSISCPKVMVTGGEVSAEIVFSSRNYTKVRIGETEYSAKYMEEGAVFTVPVKLNRAFSIFATTMAMSKVHEIEYRLYIGLGGYLPQGLAWLSEMDLKYARCFNVNYFEGGYALINVDDKESYLVVPEGMEVPDGLHPSVTVLQRPIRKAYLAATSAMSLFESIGALGQIRLSGTQEDGWYVENAVKAMKSGDILFAGKYNAPDYEMLVREDCDLAVESMMILHAPQVRELIQLLGIPVFIDRSSSEPHPLGRLEWIRLYGLMTGHETEAEEVFAKQAALVEKQGTSSDSGKTVAIFSIKPDGTVTVRGSEDYIVRSVELAGGHYVFDKIEGQETNASVSITMETFYINALNADYLLYNSAIEAPVESISELIRQQPMLADFKAVINGDVFCAEPFLYQATDGAGTFIQDLRRMLSGETDGLTFLYQIA